MGTAGSPIPMVVLWGGGRGRGMLGGGISLTTRLQLGSISAAGSPCLPWVAIQLNPTQPNPTQIRLLPTLFRVSGTPISCSAVLGMQYLGKSNKPKVLEPTLLRPCLFLPLVLRCPVFLLVVVPTSYFSDIRANPTPTHSRSNHKPTEKTKQDSPSPVQQVSCK